jgi:hypothetical protein
MELSKADLFLVTLAPKGRKGMGFKIINPPAVSRITPVEELMSDGELWEWNLMIGIGNDIY